MRSLCSEMELVLQDSRPESRLIVIYLYNSPASKVLVELRG